jgi:hypothetical protein
MIVYTAEKGRCCIFTDVFHKKMSPSRMLVKKIRDVMDESRYENQWTFAGLLLDFGEVTHLNDGDKEQQTRTYSFPN